MSDKPKPDLTRTGVGRMIDAEKKELRDEIQRFRDEQAAKDAAQDEKLARPSLALQKVKASADFTLKYPLASSVAGLAFIAGGVAFLDGARMWTLVGVGICLVPGLASKAIDLVTGLKKAKGDS